MNSLVVAVFSLLLSTSYGDTAAQKYIFGVPDWYVNILSDVHMYVSTEQTTKITIEGPGSVSKKQMTIQPGSTNISLVEWNGPYYGGNQIHNGSFVITSDREISIHVFFENHYRSEAFLVLPITEKSTDYLVTAFNNLNYIDIFTDYVTTKVSVTNLNSTESIYLNGNSYYGSINITMNMYSAMTFRYQYPTTAVKVTSDRPVAVLAYNNRPGINRTYYGYSYSLIAEHFPPLAFWKNNFIFGGLNSLVGYTIRIISSRNNNKICVGSQEFILNEAQMYEKHFDSDDAVTVEAAQPTLVLQYTETFNKTTQTIGYPYYSMIVIPAVEHYLSYYTFTVPSYFAVSQVTIYIESTQVSGLRLDDNPLSGVVERRASMKVNAKTQYSVLRFQISPGVHRLSHVQRLRFGAILYGFHIKHYYYYYYYYGTCYGLPLGLSLGPSCFPSCQNGGDCVTDNVCHCKPGFYGHQCEHGSSVEEKLKPILHSLISGYSLTNPMSWYEQPDFADNNKVCYIKIHVQNGSTDIIVSATSRTEDGLIYGNYTAGPFDSTASYQGVSRFACLEVRCPFATIDGTIKNTVVSVTIDGGNQTCKVSHHVNGISNMTMTSDLSPGDKLEFALEAGRNYGSHFGIYTGFGTLGKAKYLAEHKCNSGREYDFDSFNPEIGVLANYIC